MNDIFTSEVTKRTRSNVEAMLLDVMSKEAPATYFYRSDTGTGKTTGFIMALPKLLQAFPEARIAIAVPTINDVEEVYKQTLNHLREDEVGLWTGEHDPSNTNTPFPKRMDRSEAGERVVFIGTHRNILGDANPKRFIGERDLVIVDEVPSTSEINSLSPTDFALAREISAERGLKSAKVYADVSNRVAARQDNADRSQNTTWSTVKFPSAKGLRKELVSYKSKDVVDTLLAVIEFLEASEEDRAFERQQRTGKGHRVINTYFSDVSKYFPLKVIFSATAHLEGFQISPDGKRNLQLYTGTKVKYDNMTVRTSPWPAGVDKYVNQITSDPDQIDTAIEHMCSLIDQTEGAEVLLVMPQKLIKHFRKAVPEGTYLPKRLHVTNWGRDIGSNEYRNCRDVILWSNLHKPLDATAAEYHIFAEELVSKKTLKHFKGGRTSGPAQMLKEGQLYAQYKQMANRGAARFIKDDGTCGDMTLWISWSGFEPAWLHEILPGCKFAPVPVVEKKFLAKNTRVIDKIVSVLGGLGPDVTEISVPEYAEETGLKLQSVKNQTSKLFKESLNIVTLRLYGWAYVQGTTGRSGKPAKFIRTSDHEDEYDPKTVWNPTATAEYKEFQVIEA